eukprot:gene11265-19798_t
MDTFQTYHIKSDGIILPTPHAFALNGGAGIVLRFLTSTQDACCLRITVVNDGLDIVPSIRPLAGHSSSAPIRSSAHSWIERS